MRTMLVTQSCKRLLGVLLVVAAFSVPAGARVQGQVSPTASFAIPTKLALVYHEPIDASTGAPLPPEQIARMFDGPIIFDRNRIIRNWTAYLAGGVDPNQFVLYTNLSSFPAPKAFHDVAQEARKCTAEEARFQLSVPNRITFEAGDFCDIQNSRVERIPFDHDLSETDNDPNTNSARIIAGKDWFLIDQGSHFIQSSSPGSEYADLMPNPGSKPMQEYYIARLRREFDGGKTKDGTKIWSPTGARSLYLDNIDLSMSRIEDKSDQVVAQYSSDEQYAEGIYAWVTQIKQRLGPSIGLWGNLTSGRQDPPGWWQKYSAVLDGAMGESLLSGFWSYRYRTPEELANDIRKTDIWQKAGKQLVLPDWLPRTDPQDLRYAWATFIATTGGNKASVYFGKPRATGYRTYYHLSDYEHRLGQAGKRTITNNVAGHPIKITREFACGRVTADVNTHQGSVTIFNTPACRTLLANPGFETDASRDGKPDEWSIESLAGRSNAAKRSGSYSLRLQATGNQSPGVWQAVYGLQPNVPFDIGGWVNIPPTGDRFTFSITVAWKDTTGKELRVDTIKSWSAATSGWNQGAKQLTSPPGTEHAVVRLNASSLAAAIYVDDMLFQAR